MVLILGLVDYNSFMTLNWLRHRIQHHMFIIHQGETNNIKVKQNEPKTITNFKNNHLQKSQLLSFMFAWLIDWFLSTAFHVKVFAWH